MILKQLNFKNYKLCKKITKDANIVVVNMVSE